MHNVGACMYTRDSIYGYYVTCKKTRFNTSRACSLDYCWKHVAAVLLTDLFGLARINNRCLFVIDQLTITSS